MAHFSRLEVLNTIVETGLVPVFYHSDIAVAKKIAEAVAAGGSRVLEFTNRGDFAPLVFTELSQYLAKANPKVILGVGSVVDAPTAALYIASGANFVIGPILNPEVARLCNRRKIAYIPGCGTASEIAQAEELGVWKLSRFSPATRSAVPISSKRSWDRVPGRASCRLVVWRRRKRAYRRGSKRGSLPQASAAT